MSVALSRSGVLYTWGQGVCLGADVEEDAEKNKKKSLDPRASESKKKTELKPSYTPQKVCV
jgi:hypothetical protein